jgi:sucrose-6-phosphate hydrolase SacC (GH32 family)
MLIGAGHGGHWATALRYRSTDLVNWEFTHSFNTDTSCRMWECPQLLPLNGPTIDEASRHLLVVSRILSGPGPENDVVWQQGSYDKGRFTAFSLGHLDYGRVYYAPNGLIDAAGRLLLWGWIPEDRPRAQYKAAGWAGALTLPRVILRRRDGRLGMAPVGELQVLRSNHQHVTDIEIEPDGRDYVSSVRGDALELQAEFDARDAREFGLVLRASPDRAEQTLVLINQERGTVGIDTTRASEDPDVLGRIATGAFVPDDPARVHIHAFVDRSIVEVYVDGRAAVTARTYPSRAESIEVDARTRGSNALLRALHVWTMGSIWPGDEATPEDSPTNGKE